MVFLFLVITLPFFLVLILYQHYVVIILCIFPSFSFEIFHKYIIPYFYIFTTSTWWITCFWTFWFFLYHKTFLYLVHMVLLLLQSTSYHLFQNNIFCPSGIPAFFQQLAVTSSFGQSSSPAKHVTDNFSEGIFNSFVKNHNSFVLILL